MKKSIISLEIQALLKSNIGGQSLFSGVQLLQPLAQRPPGSLKWCDHCRKDTHDDAECWSTRVVR